MVQLLASALLLGLLIPSGFNFFTITSADQVGFLRVDQKDKEPKRIINESLGIKTTAEEIVVIDDASQRVLYQAGEQTVVPIASITKLLTALVLLDADLPWDDLVTITQEDWRFGGQVYLLPGEQVRVSELFTLMLVASSNEATVALARVSGVEDFAQAMNKKAARLGMRESNFFEPTGLDPANVASTVDVAVLAEAAFAQKRIADALQRSQYRFLVNTSSRAVVAPSTNQLLSSFLNRGDYRILGAKTGYLEEAGYCLVLRVARSDNSSLTLVLLGAETMSDRWQEAKGILEWIWRNYEWKVETSQ